MSVKRCAVCERLLQDEDVIIFVGESVYHDVPSQVMYAIEKPTACFDMAHKYCLRGEEVRLCESI